MNQVNKVFTEAWDSATKEIPFNMEWSNGTGMFDYAVYGEHAPKLGNGEMVKSITPGNRRILIVGTRLGNVAVFDRNSDQAVNEDKADTAVISMNTTSAVMAGGWFCTSALNDYEAAIAVGDGAEGNLGWRIEQLASALKKA